MIDIRGRWNTLTTVTVLADSMTLANQSAARSVPGLAIPGDYLHPPLPNTVKVFARALSFTRPPH